jgi:streptomycin 3"-adenylyltransferase
MRRFVTRPEVGLDDVATRQADAVVHLVRTVLEAKVIGVYLHGSAVLGGLRPGSDLDIIAVVRGRTTIAERRRLVDGLLRLSGPRARTPARARPPARSIELTIVRQRAVRPWRYPPRSEFQYGDRLRDDYEGGFTPGSVRSPDLALLVALTLKSDRPLFGPPPADVLDPVPQRDLVRAAVAGIPGLLADIEHDTANVVLTLARIWVTVCTSDIRTKDAAVDWAIERLPAEHRAVLARARAVYLGDASDEWQDIGAEVQAAAGWLVARIREQATDPRPAW